MSSINSQQAKQRLRVVKGILIAQFVAMFIVAALTWLLKDQIAAKSALMGGFICWLPSCYLAYRAFRNKGARQAQQIVRSLYAGEVGKIFLTMALFSIVFINVRPLDALALFAGFVLVQSINWFVPFFMSRAESRRAQQ